MLRRAAVSFLTGSAGRLTAFLLDVGVGVGTLRGAPRDRQGDALVSDDGRTAFVTGGSGFIGGRLIKRLVADGWRVRALARSDGAAEEGVRARRGAGARRPRGPRRDARRRRGRRPRLPCRRAPRRVGRPRGVRAHQRRAARAMRWRQPAHAGVRRFVHVGTEAAPAGRQAARERERGRAAAARLEGALLGDQGDGRAGGPRGQRRRLRDGRRAAPARVGRGRHDDPAGPRLGGREEALLLDRRRRPPHVHHARRQRDPWADAGRRARPARRRLLRHRRRAGGLPRVHHRAARDAGRDAARPQHSRCRSRASRLRPRRRIWRLLRRPGNPPVTRLAYWLSAQECTIDISRARAELGYEPVRSRAEGMEELRREHAGPLSPATP